jgi:aminoglycoside 6'-N-acetyltransferase
MLSDDTPSADLHLRRATPADAEILSQWDAKPHVQAAVSNNGCSGFDADWPVELDQRSDGTEFFIAEVDCKPIGALQIIDPAREHSHYWGAVATNLKAIDIWIGEEDYLGKGFGGRMMTFAVEYAFTESEVAAILIDPLSNNLKAHRFYCRFGFKFMERRQFDAESDCFVFKLTRSDWQKRSQTPIKSI